jgi:hypothetical protein
MRKEGGSVLSFGIMILNIYICMQNYGLYQCFIIEDSCKFRYQIVPFLMFPFMFLLV